MTGPKGVIECDCYNSFVKGAGQMVALCTVISIGILGPGMYMLLTRPRYIKE